MKSLCPCWNGHHVDAMVTAWNEIHAGDGAAIEDTDKDARYNVRVTARRLSFDAAYCELELSQARSLALPCVMRTDTAGHPSHAVALVACHVHHGGRRSMQALNSWGAAEAYLEGHGHTPPFLHCSHARVGSVPYGWSMVSWRGGTRAERGRGLCLNKPWV